jgi:hypothetical protein
VVRALLERGAHIIDLRNVEPTLEDVFIELVGRGLAAADEEGGRP